MSDIFNKPANLYAGSKVDIASALVKHRDLGTPEKLIKDLQDKYVDLFEAFIAGANHAVQESAAPELLRCLKSLFNEHIDKGYSDAESDGMVEILKVINKAEGA